MEGYVATSLTSSIAAGSAGAVLIEALTLATTSALLRPATPRPRPPARPRQWSRWSNHISYSCPNFKQAADWYSKVFNLDRSTPRRPRSRCVRQDGRAADGHHCKDVPVSFIIARSADRPANPRNAGRPKPEAVIEHVGYTVADFNLRARQGRNSSPWGCQERPRRRSYSLHLDDPFGYDVQISGLENNALTDG